MKRSAATLVTLLASLLFNAAPAAADGCFVWTNRDIDITEPEQKAVLVFDRGWEDLILEVKYEGPAPEFGWVVPLPSKPEMSPAKARLFEDLSMLTQERHFGMSWRGWGGAGGLASAVKLLEQKRVGIYDTTVLSSDNGEALGEWLRNNKFDL